jgi:AraC-like DNA-binding protein
MHSKSSQFIRRAEHIQRYASDFVLVTLRLDTKANKILDSKCISVTSGDISFYHGTRESRLHINDDVEALIYHVPITHLQKYIAYPEDLHGSVITGDSQIGKLTANYMLTLACQIGHMPTVTRRPIFDNFIQLLCLGLMDNQPTDVPRECIRLPLQAQVKNFILINLASPSLSPEFIAKKFRISLRYLYNLFQNEDMTLCQFIVEERLKLSKDQLMKKDLLRKTISEIAFDAGFSNVSHFCKIFKKKYNATPSEIRESCSID